jgi:hypothetical protein
MSAHSRGATVVAGTPPDSPADAARENPDSALQPWQFFLLIGMLAATAVVVVSTGQSTAAVIALSLTVIAASFVAVAIYRALVPLVLPETAEPATARAGRLREALEREKALSLRSIKELEFDFAMGKIAQSDFDEMSARLRSRAIRLMRQLDEDAGYRGAIEQELSRRLARPSTVSAEPAPSVPAGETPVADAIGDEAAAMSEEAAAMNCGSCGVANDTDARFCKNCGSRLGA